MFRISRYMHELNARLNPSASAKSVGTRNTRRSAPTAGVTGRAPAGPVVIWNLIRRCNLTCKHCYTTSANVDFPGELSTDEVVKVMADLKAFGVPVLILSGGEPMLRPDIFNLSQHAKSEGFYVGLSTNGTLIDEQSIDDVAAVNFDYVGISIDGIEATHDRFRQLDGAFEASMRGIRLCVERGIKVGMRFTPTVDNVHELPELLEVMEREQVDKLYVSHLNYGGRGNRHRGSDATHQASRGVMDQLFDAAWADAEAGGQREFVTGNNDADGVYLLKWVAQRFPEQVEYLRQRLILWGGNSSGVNIANIDNLGNVHPDTFWWNYNLGNVRDSAFGDIWNDLSDPLMRGLKSSPRPLKGRCRVCRHQDICGGNTRVRAFQLTGDPWWEDPACYLDDDELGIERRDYVADQPTPVALRTHVVRMVQ